MADDECILLMREHRNVEILWKVLWLNLVFASEIEG